MSTNIKKTDLFWIFILLSISGNPFFHVYIGNITYGIILLIFSVYLLLKKQGIYSLNDKVSYILFFCIILFALQIIVLEKVSLLASINFIVKILLGYLIIREVNTRLPLAYLKVITFVSFVSLVLYSYVMITHNTPGIIVANSRTLFFYTINMGGNILSDRNAGMFWEPGAFQGYILLTPLFFLEKIDLLWTKYKTNSIILFFTLLTTKSTTGYIVLFILIIYILSSKLKSKWLRFSLFPIVIGVVFYLFFSIDFLHTKIEKEYNQALELSVETGDYSFSRFGAAVTDWYRIKQHPIIGNGFLIESRYGLTSHDLVAFGNGFTGIINVLGIPFIVLFFFLLFNNSPMKRNDTLFFIMVIILLLQGEQFLDYPLFLSLPFFVRYVIRK